MSELNYREYIPGQEPWVKVMVDGVEREGYVRYWQLRREATPPGWWGNVIMRTADHSNEPGWFHADQITEVPEP